VISELKLKASKSISCDSEAFGKPGWLLQRNIRLYVIWHQ